MERDRKISVKKVLLQGAESRSPIPFRSKATSLYLRERKQSGQRVRGKPKDQTAA